MPYTPPTIPRAIPLLSGGKLVPNSAVAIGIMPPPPIACTALAIISIVKLSNMLDNPQNSEPMPNKVMLTM